MGGQTMTTTMFILNLIWTILGIAVFIYAFLAIREARRAKSFQSHLLHFQYIENLKNMRDLYRSYGMNEAADNLDHDIRKLINDLKI